MQELKKANSSVLPRQDNALLLSTYLNNRGCKSAAATSDLDMVEGMKKLMRLKETRFKF